VDTDYSNRFQLCAEGYTLPTSPVSAISPSRDPNAGSLSFLVRPNLNGYLEGVRPPPCPNRTKLSPSLLSGTIIRGTLKSPNSQLVTPSAQSCKGLMGAIKSGIGPFEGLDHASPEPSLEQGQPTREDLCLARGPPQAMNILSACPRPCLRQEATLTKSPRRPTKSQEHLM
jgi:hypothetical protein